MNDVPEGASGRISARATRAMVEYLEAHGGLPEDFFTGLALSREEYEGASGDGWIAREPFDALWRRVHWATGDEDIAYKIGLWAVRNRSFGALGFFARALGDPVAILGRAVERLASLDTLAEHRVAELGSRSIRIEHRYAPGAPPSRDFCFLLRGALAAAPTLWGRSPGSVVESQCAAPIDRLGALMGRTFRVDERGRVWQQDERGEHPPVVLGEVAPDGSFRFGDTVYGAPACIHELRWEAPRPGYAWVFDLLFRRRRFALEAFEEHERAKRELESRARELERHAMELERQGRALRQSEELYRGLFAQNSDGIFLVSPRTSEIEKANRAAQKLVGHKEDELRGRRLFELFPSSEWQRVRETFERAVLRGEARADAVTLRQASEQETIVELRGFTVEAGGKRFCQVILRDVTERVAQDRARSRFLRNVTHELRTPVAVIKNHGDMMLRYADMEESDRREFLRAIVDECTRLAAMIQDLLFFEKLEAGRVTLSEDEVDLADILAHFSALFGSQLEGGGIALTVDADPDLPRFIADRGKVGQVVANLLENAFRFSPRGGEVLVRARMEGEPGDERVRLVVQDQGPGVAPEHRDYIFEKYAQVRREGVENAGGMGLGLTIVREIVERHGGQVWVEHASWDDGRTGSAFIVLLPLRRAGMPPASEA